MEDYASDLQDEIAGLESPILLGHSMGGLLAQMVATRRKVAALILLAPSPPWGVTGSSIEEAITAFGVHLADPFWSSAVSPDSLILSWP